MECYFVVDDVINERGDEGFEVMYGNPFDARGFSQATFRTLREARNYVLKHDPRSGIDARRVFLARRHGEHRTEALFPITDEWARPMKIHGAWICCGFDAYERHFNCGFRTKREAEKFLSAMRRGIDSVERY